MPTLELDSEELSLLRTCVALALGGVFQDELAAGKISKIIKENFIKLEELHSKLEYPRLTKESNKIKRNRRRLKQ